MIIALDFVKIQLSFVADCPNIAAPENGKIEMLSGQAFNLTVVYSCDPGYDPMENVTVVCQEGGTWSDIPKCELQGILKRDFNNRAVYK